MFQSINFDSAKKLQHSPIGRSKMILGSSVVRVLQNLRMSWITTVMAFGRARVASYIERLN